MRAHLTCLALLLIFSFPAGAQTNRLSTSAASFSGGEDGQITVSVDSDTEIRALQFDIEIPDLIAFRDDGITASASLEAAGFSYSAAAITKRILRVVIYRADASGDIPTGVTDIADIDVRTLHSPGSTPLVISNIVASDGDGSNVTLEANPGTIQVLAPDIGVSSTRLDFGRVILGQSKTLSVLVANEGNVALSVDSLRVFSNDFECLCSFPLSLNPSTSQTLPIRYSPSKKGSIPNSLVLEIFSSDGDESKVTVVVGGSGYLVNELRIENVSARSGKPAELTLALFNMEPISALQATILLPTDADLVKGSARINAARSEEHEVAVAQDGNRVTLVVYSNSGSVFPAGDGASAYLDIIFRSASGTMPLVFDNVILASSASENVISDYHNGQAIIAAPKINIPQRRFDMGVVARGNTLTVQADIENLGQDTLRVTDIGSSSAGITHDWNLPVSIAPGQSNTVTLTDVYANAGSYDSAITFTSSDPENPKTKIDLTASVINPVELRFSSDTVGIGERGQIRVALENTVDVTALQFDLQLDASIDVIADSIEVLRTSSHSVASSKLADGRLRVIYYSGSGSLIPGTSGTVFSIPFRPSQLGNFDLSISSAIVSNPQSANVLTSVLTEKIAVLNTEVKVSYLEGWNMASRPLGAPAVPIGAIFQSYVINTLFQFDQTYLPVSDGVMQEGKGYWIRFREAENITYQSNQSTPLSIALSEGWNMIGGPICAIGTNTIADPTSILIPNTLFKYQTTYVGAEVLEPGHGYWIRANDDGVISLDCSNSDYEQGKKWSMKTEIDDSFDHLELIDASGNSQLVLIGGSLPESTDRRSFSKPPRAPGSTFDVHFTGGFFLSDLEDLKEDVLEIRASFFPVTLSMDSRKHAEYEVFAQDRDGWSPLGRLRNDANIQLDSKSDWRVRINPVEIGQGGADMNSSQLQINIIDVYPNPFSSIANVRYVIAEPATVSLTLYDTIGRRVASLVDGALQEAGTHDAQINLSGLSSGSYLLVLESGSRVRARTVQVVERGF